MTNVCGCGWMFLPDENPDHCPACVIGVEMEGSLELARQIDALSQAALTPAPEVKD